MNFTSQIIITVEELPLYAASENFILIIKAEKTSTHIIIGKYFASELHISIIPRKSIVIIIRNSNSRASARGR